MMKAFEITVPTLFGLEAVAAREVRALGYETTRVEDRRVSFLGDWEAVALSNLWLRSAERVQIVVGEFYASTFEELFEGTKALPWEEWIVSEDAQFPVKGYSLNSALFSVSDCQSIVKKAIVERLKTKYKTSWFQETGAFYQVQFGLLKDRVTLTIDTSGEGLHKRGYRAHSNAAPLHETLASAMISLSYWNEKRILADPFSGSGTISIEGAMLARNMAPGLMRHFAFEAFPNFDKSILKDAREEAKESENHCPLEILASDIDPSAVALTAKNAKLAGVADAISVRECAVKDFLPKGDYGVIICNPPYGERLSDLKAVEGLYREMGLAFHKLPTWSYYVLTSHEEFQKYFNQKATKKRKLYNGAIKCDYYQYFGPRPPREA